MIDRREFIGTCAALLATGGNIPKPCDGGFLVPPEFVPELERSFRRPGMVLCGPPVRIARHNLTIEEVCKLRGVL